MRYHHIKLVVLPSIWTQKSNNFFIDFEANRLYDFPGFKRFLSSKAWSFKASANYLLSFGCTIPEPGLHNRTVCTSNNLLPLNQCPPLTRIPYQSDLFLVHKNCTIRGPSPAHLVHPRILTFYGKSPRLFQHLLPLLSSSIFASSACILSASG